MICKPVQYDEPLFRPPAEAYSAIVQITIGCSWNRCAFCEMYTSKKFRIRQLEDIVADIKLLVNHYNGTRKVFLADGNAIVLSTVKLLPILNEINRQFGRIQRISSYALPADIRAKTNNELLQLKKAGLKLVYIGIETGDDELLDLVQKGESFNSMEEAVRRAHESGIETSLMIINGLGGKQFSNQHALRSAELINRVNPKFLSTLTLSLPYGLKHFQERFIGEYTPQTIVELAEELKLFIGNLEVKNTIFRSDHVSNYLILKGVLPKDRQKMLESIDRAIPLIARTQYPSAPGVL